MSNLFKLDSKDLLRGLILASLTAVLGLVYQLLQNQGFSLSLEDLSNVLKIAITSGLGYLLKNLATDDGGKLMGIAQIK